MITEEKKLEYREHFTDRAQKGFRPRNITDLRLGLMKDIVLDDSGFWQDLMIPCEAAGKTPDEFMAEAAFDYHEIRSKFWTLMRRKIEIEAKKLNKRSKSPKNK